MSEHQHCHERTWMGGLVMIIIGGILVAPYFGLPTPSLTLIAGSLLIFYGLVRIVTKSNVC